jgi:hypothetical protein
MVVKASATITVSCYRDTSSITRYYKLQSSTLATPSKPTSNPPSGWDDTEPAYTSGNTNTLYFCDLTEFSDGTYLYSEVSKSSSYEAAKQAYNKAIEAAKTATNFFELTDSSGLVVGNLTADTLKGNVQIKAESGGASVSLRDGTTNLAKFSAVSKAFTGVTSATTSTSSSTVSETGEAGDTSSTVTYAYQTVVNNQTNPVVRIDSSQPVYFPQGITTNGVIVNDNSLISNVNFTLNGRIFDKNGKSAFEPYTGEGNLSIGYGRFKAATSSSTDWTILYGNKAKIATKNGIWLTQDGSTAFETLNSNGNASLGYHLYKKGTGDTNIYGGDDINLRAKTTSIIDSTGSSCFEAKNGNGNTVIGYARYSKGGNTNIYGGTAINLVTNSGNVVTNCSIIPDTNSSWALGKYNELGWSNIYIGNASGVYNGLRVIVDGSSKNLCGRDGDGHVIFGNIDSVMHYQAKNVNASNTGNAFRITSGNNDAKNNTTSIWFFGAADSTSRYVGSYMAYDRTYSSAANMFVTANGVFGRSTSSSEKYKTDIKMADISELNGLYDLPVKKFKYRDDYISEDDELYKKDIYGFVVEDLDDILPCAVQHISEDGKLVPEMWNNNIMVPALLKLIQDLNERVKVIEGDNS